VLPEIRLIGLPGIGEVAAGHDLGRLILSALDASALSLADGDVLVVASKIISKAEGRILDLGSVQPGPQAEELARITGKDPRFVQAVLDEAEGVSRAAPNVLVVRHRLGFTSANAGLDRSNLGAPEETVLLLPEDPDASADRLRGALEAALGLRLGVVVADTHGRPFRRGNIGVAIGVSGLAALVDQRGRPDLYGRILEATLVPQADQLAAAAGMVGGEAAEGLPVVVVRGAALQWDDGRASDLVRPPEEDLYRSP
jgi:coenzyme F420-0:L-glutamate ligase/coenzyme F420-1:gamma-L-glutamate ligase